MHQSQRRATSQHWRSTYMLPLAVMLVYALTQVTGFPPIGSLWHVETPFKLALKQHVPLDPLCHACGQVMQVKRCLHEFLLCVTACCCFYFCIICALCSMETDYVLCRQACWRAVGRRIRSFKERQVRYGGSPAISACSLKVMSLESSAILSQSKCVVLDPLYTTRCQVLQCEGVHDI